MSHATQINCRLHTRLVAALCLAVMIPILVAGCTADPSTQPESTELVNCYVQELGFTIGIPVQLVDHLFLEEELCWYPGNESLEMERADFIYRCPYIDQGYYFETIVGFFSVLVLPKGERPTGYEANAAYVGSNATSDYYFFEPGMSAEGIENQAAQEVYEEYADLIQQVQATIKLDS